MRYLLYLVWCSLLAIQSAAADELVIKYANSLGQRDSRQDYYLQLLTLALKKTATDTPFRLELHPTKMLQSRAIKLLNQTTELDITWAMTSIKRERLLLPVRIPLLKGLLGHRVLMIRQQDKKAFSHIKTRSQLIQLIAGQGRDWPDTEILRANQFKVQTAPTHTELFNMLEAGRFDYFPRGVNEAWAELQVRADKAFMIQPTLLLYYRSPAYFFLAPNNHKLANRIEKGLRIAIKDGSFDQLFYHNINNQGEFNLDNLKNRQIIELHNPLLSELTPIAEKALWYHR